MAHPERHDATPPSIQPMPAADRHWPGGQVGRMQADLARRLASDGAARAPASADGPGERFVRFVSAAGGYAALAAAYAGMVLLVPR